MEQATDGAETAAIDGLVSSWSENIFASFCQWAPGYGSTLWCALRLLVGGTIQVPQLQLQLHSGHNSREVFVCMSAFVVKMLTLSPAYFGPQNLLVLVSQGWQPWYYHMHVIMACAVCLSTVRWYHSDPCSERQPPWHRPRFAQEVRRRWRSRSRKFALHLQLRVLVYE